MTNKIATEQYVANLLGDNADIPTKCATKAKAEQYYAAEVTGSYASNQLIREEDVTIPSNIYTLELTTSLVNNQGNSVTFDGVLDIYIAGLTPDAFVSYTIDNIVGAYQVAHLFTPIEIELPTLSTSLIMVRYLNGNSYTAKVKVQADNVTKEASVLGAKHVDIPINTQYIIGDIIALDVQITI